MTDCLTLTPQLLALLCDIPQYASPECPTFTCTPSGGGVLYEIRPGADSQTDWDAAVTAMNSTGGNVIRFLPGAHPGIYRLRGSEHDPGPAESGVAGNHNCIDGTGAVLTGTDPNPNLFATLGLDGVKHWDVHNITITGGFIGLRLMSSGGTAGSRAVISNVNISGTDDARLVLNAWFSDQTVPTEFVDVYCPTLHTAPADDATPWYGEGLYIGTGSPTGTQKDETHDINVYGLYAYDLTADAVDIKANAYNIQLFDSLIHDIDLNQFGPTGDTPDGAISVWASNDGIQANEPTPNIGIYNTVIYNINGVSPTFHYPIALGVDSVTVSNLVAWNYTADAPIRVRPFTEVTGLPVNATCITAPESTNTVTVFDPDGTGVTVNETCNLNATTAAGTQFVGPTTGTADAGWGTGTGFVPVNGTAPTCTGGCATDIAGCPSSIIGAFTEAPAGWTP